MNFNIVLITPEIPQNTGNIGRTCAAIGARLHIVGPTPFEITEKAARRAGLDYWQHLDLMQYASLDEFFSSLPPNANLTLVETGSNTLYTDITYPEDTWLLFGCETKGLPAELLNANKGRVVSIPTLPHIRSLNLSNAVAIVAFEVVRQHEL